jgi:hypothetical protein
LSGQQGGVSTTPEVVYSLQLALKKPVRVSTSLDSCFGAPTDYFSQSLASYETRLKSTINANKSAIEDGEQQALEALNRERDQEVSRVRQYTGAARDAEPVAFYPQGKVEQYRDLVAALPRLIDTSADHIQVDYFDDSIRNLVEVDEGQYSIKPHCKLVGNCSQVDIDDIMPSLFQADWNDRSVDREALQLINSRVLEVDHAKINQEFTKQVLQQDNPVIRHLESYIETRELEFEQTRCTDQYHTLWARIFTPVVGCYQTKISAANKAKRILSGEFGVLLSNEELEALEQGRLKQTLGKSIDIIKDYRTTTPGLRSF